MTTLSVIVPMGFVGQFIHDEFGNDTHGPDEFEHMAPLADTEEGVELIIIDRDWPNRWGRVQEVLGVLIDRNVLVYAPPKPGTMIESGYRACCTMRNSGAILSSGDILAFVDDYVSLEGRFVPEIIDHYERTGLVLCPVTLPSIDQATPEGPPSDFGGHNAGIYMCSREQFIELNGFDENLDGAYGEEDTEFQDRLDRLLWLRQKGYRQRRRGLIWERVEHTNGEFPQETKALWAGQTLMKGRKYKVGNLRCNKSYVQHVSYPRIQKESHYRGNIPPTKEQLAAMRAEPCREDCPRCNDDDREQQLESYLDVLKVDVDISAERAACPGPFCGKTDPWS